MKVISDIRLYKSSNIDNHLALTNKSLNLAVHRVVMKLREQGFSLGDFDHLYINFSTLVANDTVSLIDKADNYHPWYRYCDIGISPNEYNNLENSDFEDNVYEKIKSILLKLFNTQENVRIIETAFSEAKKGAEMLMWFKEKKTSKGVATVFLRLLDNGRFLPLLCVNDIEGTEILRVDLPETIDLNIIGEILLTNKMVTVKPRKNALARGLKPIIFNINL